ncbi:MAG TPA: DUF433 domain-containing protein, partial [Solirubrobacteraceae bacterium]|nr:DUF433 domain-containing protein [Solirubrobacteraceae bacterium]
LLAWDTQKECWRSVDIPEHEVIEATLIDLTEISKSLAHGGWVAIENPRAHIEVDPDMHSGTPVVKGRRLPTTLVAGIASRDDGRETLRDDYGLSDAEIDDAVDYEADLARLAAA